jgi:hypothetical protein
MEKPTSSILFLRLPEPSFPYGFRIDSFFAVYHGLGQRNGEELKIGSKNAAATILGHIPGNRTRSDKQVSKTPRLVRFSSQYFPEPICQHRPF